MKEQKLAELRKETASLIGGEIKEWDEKFARLCGIVDAIEGDERDKVKRTNIIAKKLCSYYMRRDGYGWQKIADTIGVKNHATPLYHYGDCMYFLRDDGAGDKTYLLVHKKAKEMGIAV